MNLEKNIQEFKGFLAGKYDHYLTTRGDEYAGWNYFTEAYFDCLEYEEKEEVFFQLLLGVDDSNLSGALGYTQWLIAPPKTYLDVFLRIYTEGNCAVARKEKIFNYLFHQLNDEDIWCDFEGVSQEKMCILKEIAEKFNIPIQRKEFKELESPIRTTDTTFCYNFR